MKFSLNYLWRWIKQEGVFSIIFCLTLISLFFVPPSPVYLSYIDWNTIFILFALMTVVAGFSSCGLFSRLGTVVCRAASGDRTLAAVLIYLCFFTSMLITNDVALLTFVPFSVALLGTERKNLLIRVIVLQTIAANTGSMLTPIGNPQNLFLFAQMSVSLGMFLLIMLPLTAAAGIILAVTVFICIPKSSGTIAADTVCRNSAGNAVPVRKALVYGLLFLLSLGSVLHVIPAYVTAGIIFLFTVIFDRSSLRNVDFMLLLTFICFFIFTGNIAEIEPVRVFLQEKISGADFPAAVIVSQVISNVPATLMLFPFSGNITELLLGVNTGGLGSLVASLASLISFKLYAKTKDADSGAFFWFFTLLNVIFLLLLILFKIFIYREIL